MANIKRLESDLKKALTEILREEAKDPDIGFLTVTDVDLTNDLSYLTIHFTVFETEETTRESVLKALERSKKFLRTLLMERVKMRKAPELRFRYDESLETGNRIEKGLKKVLDKDKKD